MILTFLETVKAFHVPKGLRPKDSISCLVWPIIYHHTTQWLI